MDYAKLATNRKTIEVLRENMLWTRGLHCFCRMDACTATIGIKAFSGIRLQMFKRACPVGPFGKDIDTIVFVKNKAILISKRFD